MEQTFQIVQKCLAENTYHISQIHLIDIDNPQLFHLVQTQWKICSWEEEEGKIPVDMEKVCNWGNVNPKSQAKEATLGKVANNPFTQPWEESNVVLIVEGVKFYVHHLILILNSPVFKNMLESGLKEAPTAEITLPGKDADDILNLLKQLYPQEREEISSKF